MNTDTGVVYRTKEEIEAAFARGEPLVPVSDVVAEMVERGRQSMLAEGIPLTVEKIEAVVQDQAEWLAGLD